MDKKVQISAIVQMYRNLIPKKVLYSLMFYAFFKRGRRVIKKHKKRQTDTQLTIVFYVV